MILSYKNQSSKTILKKFKNINYTMNTSVFGFGNTLNIDLELNLDASHIRYQADVFARQLIINNSALDLKRALGPKTEEWYYLLHVAYIYDRCKCVYYGMYSNNFMSFPENSVSFPGNLLLANLLKDRNFQFYSDDSQNFNLIVRIISKKSVQEMLEPIFYIYPDLQEGMSDTENYYSYVNSRYETILRGLHNAGIFASSRRGAASAPYTMYAMNSETIANFTSNDNNPILNSFLSPELDEFNFIQPAGDEGGERSLKFNESVFISRALGFTSNAIKSGVNNMYVVVPRDTEKDIFARDEMHSVTGIKTEMVPFSHKQMNDQMGVDRVIFGVDYSGGKDANTPS